MSVHSISRRRFLKMGCLTAAAAGLTVCGVGLAIPDQAPVDQPSFTVGEKTMNNRVLVAYASHFGSTAEVAAAIGKTLAARGLAVDVKPIRENLQMAGDLRSGGYQTVVIGSAVEYGKWLPEAVDFVKTNQQALNRVPVALFSVHIQNLADDEKSRQARLAYLDTVRPLIRPVAQVFFAGKFDRRGAAVLMPGLLARFIPPMDLRDWEKIRAWAQTVSAG